MMKAILSLGLLLSLSSQVFAYSLQELEGKYKLTGKQLKLENVLTLDKSGSLKLVGKNNEYTCKGNSKLSLKNIITADLKCDKIYPTRTFNFTIDLSKVHDLNNFEAPLMFPMIGEITFKSERLEN